MGLVVVSQTSQPGFFLESFVLTTLLRKQSESSSHVLTSFAHIDLLTEQRLTGHILSFIVHLSRSRPTSKPIIHPDGPSVATVSLYCIIDKRRGEEMVSMYGDAEMLNSRVLFKHSKARGTNREEESRVLVSGPCLWKSTIRPKMASGSKEARLENRAPSSAHTIARLARCQSCC